MAQKEGCVNCRSSEVELGYHEVSDVLGQRYQIFFCHPCFALYQEQLSSATEMQKAQFENNLAQLVSGKK